MPLKGDAKREYQRAYMRRRRSGSNTLGESSGVKRGSGGEKGVRPVRPTKSKHPSSRPPFASLVYTLRRRVAMLERELLGVRLLSQERLTALEVAQAVHEAEHALGRERVQRAEAILDDRRRELLEEEP